MSGPPVAAQERQAADVSPPIGECTLAVLLGAAALVDFLSSLPLAASAQNFLLGDAGAVLRADHLLRLGLRPGVDFPFNYGPLALAVQRLVIVVLGSSPWSQVVVAGVLEVAVGVLIGLIGSRLGVRRWGAALLVVLIPHVLHITWVVASIHSLETTLIILSFAVWLRGAPSLAGLCALGAGLVKPGMGFALSLAYLGHGVWVAPTRSVLVRRLLGYCTGGAMLLLPLACFVGLPSVASAVLAVDGRRHYAAMHYGMHQLVHGFLAPPGVNVAYFFGTPVALWLILLCIVTAAALDSLRAKADDSRKQRPFLLMTAGMTWIWILVTFGNGFSWSFYLYAMVLGSAAALEPLPARARRVGTAVLLLLGLLSYRTVLEPRVRAWAEERPRAAFSGLWADETLARDWMQVRRLAERSPMMSVTWGGNVASFGPLGSAPYWMLAPGLDAPRVIREVQHAIAGSCLVVRDHLPRGYTAWLPAAVERQLGSLELERRGEVFTVYRNRRVCRRETGREKQPGH